MMAQPLKLAPPLSTASVLAHERKSSSLFSSPSSTSTSKSNGVWYLILVIPDKSIDRLSNSTVPGSNTLTDMMISESNPYRISRRYEDFVHFHITLLQQLQSEGQFRDFKLVQVLPELSRGRKHLFTSSKTVVESKRVLLDKYVKALLKLPTSVTKRLLVSSFFGLWSTDVNLPPLSPQALTVDRPLNKQKDSKITLESDPTQAPSQAPLPTSPEYQHFVTPPRNNHNADTMHSPKSQSKLSKFLPAIFTLSRRGKSSNNSSPLSPSTTPPGTSSLPQPELIPGTNTLDRQKYKRSQSIQSTNRGRPLALPEVVDLDEKWLADSKERRLSRHLILDLNIGGNISINGENTSGVGDKRTLLDPANSSLSAVATSPRFLTLVPPPNLTVIPDVEDSPVEVDTSTTKRKSPRIPLFGNRSGDAHVSSEPPMEIGLPQDVKTTSTGNVSPSRLSPTILDRPSMTTMIPRSTPSPRFESLPRFRNPSQASSAERSSSPQPLRKSDSNDTSANLNNTAVSSGITTVIPLEGTGLVTIPRRGSSRNWETLQRKQSNRAPPVLDMTLTASSDREGKGTSPLNAKRSLEEKNDETPLSSTSISTGYALANVPLLPLHSKHSLDRNGSSNSPGRTTKEMTVRSPSHDTAPGTDTFDAQPSLFSSLKRKLSRGRRVLKLNKKGTSRSLSVNHADDTNTQKHMDAEPGIIPKISAVPDSDMSPDLLSRIDRENNVDLVDDDDVPLAQTIPAKLSAQADIETKKNVDFLRVAAKQATLERTTVTTTDSHHGQDISHVVTVENPLLISIPDPSVASVRGPGDDTCSNTSLPAAGSTSPLPEYLLLHEQRQQNMILGATAPRPRLTPNGNTTIQGSQRNNRTSIAKRSLAALKKATERRQADRDFQRNLDMVLPPSNIAEQSIKRRSLYQMDSPMLFRNHTLSSGQAGNELDRHFIFVKARIEEDVFIKCRVSRTIGFDQLMDRLELKFGQRGDDLPSSWKTSIDPSTGETRLCLAGAGYIDSDDNFLDIEDEGDWLVCLEEAVSVASGEIDIRLFVEKEEGGIYPENV